MFNRCITRKKHTNQILIT